MVVKIFFQLRPAEQMIPGDFWEGRGENIALGWLRGMCAHGKQRDIMLMHPRQREGLRVLEAMM